MANRNLIIAMVGGALLAGAMTTNASAEGFLAGLARDAGLINEQQRRTIDGFHAGLGRPFDHAANQAAGAAVDYFAPGYGRVVTQGLEMRDQMRRQAAAMGHPVGYAPAPTPMPMPYGGYGAPYGYGNPMPFAAPMAIPMPYPMY